MTFWRRLKPNLWLAALFILLGVNLAHAEDSERPRLLKKREKAPEPLVQLAISGASDRITANIEAYLTPLPTTAAERRAFIFTLEKQAQQALEALGYYNAELSLVVDQDSEIWPINLEVKPGPQVHYRFVMIWVEGEASGDPELGKVLENSAIAPGKPLHHGQYQTLKNSILSEALVRGYFDGKFVQSSLEVDRDQNLADVTLVFDSGERYLLGEVRFNEFDLEPELLEALIPFEPGQAYTSDAIASFNSSLLESGYFGDLRVLPLVDKAEQQRIPIDVQLSAASRHTVDLGVGYTTDNGPRATTTWRTPKINRAGHSQQLTLELSKNPQLNWVYRIPLEHPTQDQLLFNAVIDQDQYGDIDNEQYGLRVARQTHLGGGWVREYYLRWIQEQWKAVGQDFDAQLLLPGISWSKTKRWGSPLDPRRGFRQSYSIEHADTIWGADTRITQARSQLKWIDTPFAGHRFVLRADLGASQVDNAELLDLPPSMRFFAGGDISIRGFGYQSLGPKEETINDQGETVSLVVGGRYLMVGSAEYQYYLSDSWRVATFIDAGNAFNTQDFSPVYSVGIGLHWISPVGPIKADFGYGISEDDPPFRLHLTIGSGL